MSESKAPDQSIQKSLPPLALVLAGKNLPAIPGTATKILLTKTAQGWESQEIATLGESDLFVVRDKGNTFRGFKKYVTLYENKKELANFEGGSWMITVAGYNRLNQIGALHTITPPIFYEGKEYPNPYPIVGPSGEIRKYVARKIVLGFSPTGNLVAVDVVRYYDFEAYYLQSLLAKAKGNTKAARMGSEYVCPFSPDDEVKEKDGTKQFYCKTAKGEVYIFKRLKDDEAVGIWINVSDPDIFAVYKEHTQHMKFGDVIAQTVCGRNAMKAHPAIAATTVQVTGTEKNHEARVLVYGFMSQLTQKDIANVGDMITKGQPVPGVSVEISAEDISEEDAKVEMESVAGEEGETEPGAGARSEAPSPAESALKDQLSKPPVAQTKETKPAVNPLDETIKAHAKEKGIDLVKFTANLFEITGPWESLDKAGKEKLLEIIKKTASGKKGAK